MRCFASRPTRRLAARAKRSLMRRRLGIPAIASSRSVDVRLGKPGKTWGCAGNPRRASA